MRIAISCNSFGAGGGLERYALDITRALCARVDEPVVVYARSFDAEALQAGSAQDGPVEARSREPRQGRAAVIEPHRIDVSRVPSGLRDYFFSYALQRARRQAGGGEVLIGCNRVRGSEIAICGGTHRGYLNARQRRPRLSDRLRIRLEADQYAGAWQIVAHSRLMQAELRELYGIPESRISLLYPPVDTSRFAPVGDEERRALRAKYGFGDDVVFLFPSSDHGRKGFDVLAPEFSRSDLPVTLVVAGRPVRENLPRIRSLGYCREIEELYRAADFTILASDYEPFGLVGVESVLSGTPLVLADNIACLEVIGSEAVETFSRTSADSVRSALERAVARVRSGTGRLPDPRAVLAYDPEPGSHAQALIALCRLVAASGEKRQAVPR